jgi:uncharacterized membrane protein required for colicin V production
LPLSVEVKAVAVDIALLLILAFCVVWGYIRGGIEDILGLGALVVAFLASAPFGAPMGRILGANFGWSPGVSYLIGRIIAALCIYIPLIILASFIDRRLGRTEQGVPHPWNRVLGFLWGFGSGLVLFFILLFGMDVILKVFPDSSGWIVRQAGESKLRQWASSFNPADRYLITDVLRLYRAARHDPQVVARLRDEPQVRKLLESASFKRLLDDQSVAQAVRDSNVGAVLTNENFRLVLADKELRAEILSPEMHRAFEEALEKTPEIPPAPSPRPAPRPPTPTAKSVPPEPAPRPKPSP